MRKVAIVTGGARGIGREIVIMLINKGFDVIINYYHSEKQAQELQKEVRNTMSRVELFKADVSKREEAQSLVEFVLKRFDRIDVLVNNAGVSEYKLFTEETDEDWQRVINTNLYSAFVMCQEVAPSMIQKKAGSIINISSIWGMVGASLEVLYSISKAGMDGLTKALAKELGPSGIRVNSIAPGVIDTEMIHQELSEEEIKELEKEIPLGKIGKTRDVARCVSWLVEDEYTTGQIISPNGGWII